MKVKENILLVFRAELTKWCVKGCLSYEVHEIEITAATKAKAIRIARDYAGDLFRALKVSDVKIADPGALPDTLKVLY